MLIRTIPLSFLIMLFFGSCTYDINPECNISSAEAENIKSFISNKCVGCHSSSSTGHYPNLSEITQIENNINNIIDRIKRDPGDPGFMPEGGTKLTDCEIDSIIAWRDNLSIN